MNTNITINWKGKTGQRGLTETAIDTLKKAGNEKDAGYLETKYRQLLSKDRFSKSIDLTAKSTRVSEQYTWEKELAIVTRVVRVLL